jgi:hypothetical protein
MPSKKFDPAKELKKAGDKVKKATKETQREDGGNDGNKGNNSRRN